MPALLKHSQLKPKNKLPKIVIWLSAVMIIGIVVFCNLTRLVVTYMYLFNTESFNTGQKIYPSKNVWNYPSDSFGTLREIRPVTAREAADTFMIIKTDHEDLLQMVQKDSLRPYVQNFSFFIDKEKLKRQGSAALGTYIGTYIKHTKTREGQDVLGVYYAVRPNLSIMNNDFKSYDMPPYYKFSNDVLYLPISFGGNEELITR